MALAQNRQYAWYDSPRSVGRLPRGIQRTEIAWTLELQLDKLGCW